MACRCRQAHATSSGRAGRACRLNCRPSTVLLRIGFTGPHGLPCAGELLPRLSTLTETGLTADFSGISLLHFPWGRPRRRLAVILALWSSDFPQTRAFASRPQLPGLLTSLLYRKYPASVNSFFQKASGSFHPKAFETGPRSSCGDSQTGLLPPTKSPLARRSRP